MGYEITDEGKKTDPKLEESLRYFLSTRNLSYYHSEEVSVGKLVIGQDYMVEIQRGAERFTLFYGRLRYISEAWQPEFDFQKYCLTFNKYVEPGGVFSNCGILSDGHDFYVEDSTLVTVRPAQKSEIAGKVESYS